jgi:hypothetical protein
LLFWRRGINSKHLFDISARSSRRAASKGNTERRFFCLKDLRGRRISSKGRGEQNSKDCCQRNYQKPIRRLFHTTHGHTKPTPLKLSRSAALRVCL